jgi:tetratricopeptide (TPR) repeat protein
MTQICLSSFDSGKKRLLRMGLPLLRWTLACLFLSQLHCTLVGAQSTSTEVRFREATEALRAGHLDEAGDKFATITKDSPGFAEAHLNLGLIREEQGRNEEAIASLQKALTLRPRLRGANLFLAIAEYRLNHFDKAISALQKETSYYPSDANAWMWLGVVQLAAENPEDAVAALDKAAKLAPDNVDILYHRGRAHLLVSKNSYEKMFQVDPHSWRVHQVLAQADAEADRSEEAIAEYQAAIQLAPKQPGLHDELGTEYWKAGKLELAEAALQQELEIDPNNVLARYKLGQLEVGRGEGAKSKVLLEAAVRQDPSLKNSSYYLGRAEMELGNYAAAAESFERTVSAPGVDRELVQQAWYQLGVAYRHLHRVEDAQKAFTTFQRLKDEEAQEQQERLKKKREASSQSTAPSAPEKPN